MTLSQWLRIRNLQNLQDLKILKDFKPLKFESLYNSGWFTCSRVYTHNSDIWLIQSTKLQLWPWKTRNVTYLLHHNDTQYRCSNVLSLKSESSSFWHERHFSDITLLPFFHFKPTFVMRSFKIYEFENFITSLFSCFQNPGVAVAPPKSTALPIWILIQNTCLYKLLLINYYCIYLEHSNL